MHTPSVLHALRHVSELGLPASRERKKVPLQKARRKDLYEKCGDRVQGHYPPAETRSGYIPDVPRTSLCRRAEKVLQMPKVWPHRQSVSGRGRNLCCMRRPPPDREVHISTQDILAQTGAQVQQLRGITPRLVQKVPQTNEKTTDNRGTSPSPSHQRLHR